MSNGSINRHQIDQFLHRDSERISEALRLFSLEPRAPILVGASGGKDSTYMALLLSALGFCVHCLVIDLGYPGFNSSAIQDNLRALDLAAYTYKVRDEICNHSLSNDDTIILTEQLRTLNSPECRTPCTACSKSKRIALAHYARKNNISYIALGHHLDDFLSTLLKDYYINRYYQDCGKYDWVRFRNYIQNTPIDHKGVAQQCSAGIASTMGFKLILGQGLTLFRPMILLSETNIITAISKANISTFGSGCSHSSYVSGSLPPSKREIVHAAFRIMQESNPELSSSLVPIMLASLSPSGEPLSSPRSERSRRLPDFE